MTSQQLLRCVAEWRAVLRQHVTIARQMLRKLVAGRVCFTLQGDAAEMVLPPPRDRMLATGTLVPKAMVTPAGSAVVVHDWLPFALAGNATA